jgi:hypothetical protein
VPAPVQLEFDSFCLDLSHFAWPEDL